MKRIVRLTESDLHRIVKNVINEIKMPTPEQWADINNAGRNYNDVYTDYGEKRANQLRRLLYCYPDEQKERHIYGYKVKDFDYSKDFAPIEDVSNDPTMRKHFDDLAAKYGDTDDFYTKGKEALKKHLNTPSGNFNGKNKRMNQIIDNIADFQKNDIWDEFDPEFKDNDRRNKKLRKYGIKPRKAKI